MSSLFERNVPGSTERLGRASAGIAGCGGLGSNAAVALARAGIGRLILADFDTVEVSNLNRQYYFQQDVGRLKVEVLAERLKEINPGIDVKTYAIRLAPADVKEVFNDVDILIEAFDRAENKRWLIESWCISFPDRPIVGASGLSGIGRSNDIKVRSSGNIYIVGDETTDSGMGLCSARVAIAANMQANVAIELMNGRETQR